jgi:outer membrane lipoprotein LolB
MQVDQAVHSRAAHRGRIARSRPWRAFLAVAVLTLGACASAPPRPAADSLAGRLVLQVSSTETEAARVFSASFELRGAPEAGQLDLLAPTGTVVARARWQPGGAQVESSQGTARYASLADLTQRTLGERLPMEALFDWLQGRPWPALAHQRLPQGFEQAGWVVDVSALGRGSIVARRDSRPVVTLRLRLDQTP